MMTQKAKLLWMTSHSGTTVVRKCHRNTISRFHLMAHYVSGVNFTRNYILRHPPHSEIIFALIAFVHKIITSWLHLFHGYEGCQKFEMRSLCPWLHFLNPTSIGFDKTVEDNYCATFQDILIRVFISSFILSCNVHTHTHRDKMISISVPPYTTSLAWIEKDTYATQFYLYW